MERRAKGRKRRSVAQDTETRQKKAAFLKAYSGLGNVTAAAKMAGIERKSHYRWLEKGGAYEDAFADAEEQATERLERHSRRLGPSRELVSRGGAGDSLPVVAAGPAGA